jgi:hypothetical protein
MVHFLLKRCKYLNFAAWRHISARLAGFKAKSRAGGAANRATHDPEKACPREGGDCRLFGQDHAQNQRRP